MSDIIKISTPGCVEAVNRCIYMVPKEVQVHHKRCGLGGGE
jgi:hypothetical protein